MRSYTAFGERPSLPQAHVADLVRMAGEPMQHQNRRIRTMVATCLRQRKDPRDLVMALPPVDSIVNAYETTLPHLSEVTR